MRIFSVMTVVVLAAGALFMWIGRSGRIEHVSPHRRLLRAQIALEREQFQLAEELASSIARADEEWSRSRLVAGEVAMRTGRSADALRYFGDVLRDGSPAAVVAALSSGELEREAGRLSQAEREYGYALEQDPGNLPAHERLAFLLGATGRRWESLPHFLAIVRNGRATREQLVLLGDLERPLEASDVLGQWVGSAPDELLVQLAQATAAVTAGRSAEARRLLATIIARDPRLVAAQAMLGELLVDAADPVFLKWHAGLPPEAADYPDIWYVRGLAARRRDNLPVAARCFWETVRLAPTHRRGTYQLSQVLVSLGRKEHEEFSERAARLLELTRAIDDVVRADGSDEPTMKRVTELLEATSRALEACAWSVIAAQAFPEATWPETTFARLSPLLGPGAPQVLDAENLALRYDLSGFPDHEKLLAQMKREAQDEPPAVRAAIRFEAALPGPDFVYFNAHDSSRKGARMLEQTGGGVAALDFDADGWPDLFFTQGTEWPFGAPEPTPTGNFTDRLFRNLGGGALSDVTLSAGLVDSGFGQGCTAGDFDNDGFADLYVANIGRNQLLRNNGDGTFSDVTTAAGIERRDWTASCLIADLNADGAPDLFDVTYVTGPHVYDAICNGHACSPKVFEGIPDRLRLSRGDGTFELIPQATPEENSKGLGIVAFDLYDRGRPCLFIANDQVPGFFLRNMPTDDRLNVRFADEGFASGLAFNEDGLAMAGMGIAADDVNGDGRVDFYVTTFKGESKILFLQEAGGLFIDATNAAGLRAPGMPYVGWGAQFLDADRDGAPDLVTTNGHVDDYRDQGGQYQMRPQCFRNLGGGRFEELAGGTAGEFFERTFLGRGLARLDWDRDGRMDFVVSNIGDRASLVMNRTEGCGHFLNVRLHATATARDAIGSVVEISTVEISAGTPRRSKQLVAGDGYMASNERMLQFGLGAADSISELRVNWPSGATTRVRNVPIDVTVELVEGRLQGALWRGAEPAAFAFEGQIAE